MNTELVVEHQSVFAVRLLLHDEDTTTSIQTLLLVEDNDKECWLAV